MKLEIELAWRFLRRRRGPLLRGTALAALAGVALGVAALVITLALMAGYREAIATALQQGNAHLAGFAMGSLDGDRAAALVERILAVPGVRRASPVLYLAGLLDDPAYPSSPAQVVVKAVGSPPPFVGLAAWPEEGGAVAVVGGRLAAKLDLEAGDAMTVRLPPRPGSWTGPAVVLTLVGTFQLSFAEFDAHWIVAPLDAVLAAAPGSEASGIEVEIDDPMDVDAMRVRLETEVGELMFTDWREMNRPLFAALEWQTLSLFVVLSLVVAVASFQVSSAMVVLAIDKRRSAGTLQALGATPQRVRRVLVLAGGFLGSAGVAAGLAVGCALSAVLTRWRVVRFPEGLAQVYMVDSIPFRVEPASLVTVAAVGIALVVLASYWPARRAAAEDPVAALRAV